MTSIHLVVMAGGLGTRLWPLSRQSKPKPFLSLLDDQSLCHLSLKRLHGIVEPANRWIVGSQAHESLFKEIVNGSSIRLLLEPSSKNTGPCVAWVTQEVLAVDPSATVVIIPADHWVSDRDVFKSTIQSLCDYVQQTPSIGLVGILPRSPHTGYGYIQSERQSGISSVRSFKEKPDLETAKKYISSGNYFWNSGIVVAPAKYLMDQLNKYCPDIMSIFSSLSQETDASDLYDQLPSISFDHAVLEKMTDNLVVSPASFEWSDLGTWSALGQFLKRDDHGNSSNGFVRSMGATNTMAFTSKPLVALGKGVDDLMIIETDDTLVVVSKDHVDDTLSNLYNELDDSFK